MNYAFVQKDIELADPIVLSTTAGDNSMPYVIGLMKWLESKGAKIKDSECKTENYENLIEKGIKVQFDSVTFLFTCSNENFIIKRISGDKVKFWGLIELFKETEC